MPTPIVSRRSLLGTPAGWSEDMPAIVQRIYAARGVLSPQQNEQRFALLHSPTLLGGIGEAAALLGNAILENRQIIVAGDYDCDGATGTAVAVRGLRLLGAKRVGFIVPNRFVHGYGLSPALVDAMEPAPDVIVTVDSGVASVEGVAHAKAKGYTVVITDHHLPGDNLPAADAIVNPNLKGDTFPSKMLAGVGVMFYVLLAVRAFLRDAGQSFTPEQDLTQLLDLVAIGTVADLVPLDHNNRILVEAGLRRIRQGQSCVGVKTLLASAGKAPETLCAQDIAFAIAPRLNAAGRLEDMRLGVLTLITDDPMEAASRTAVLEDINKDRKERQAEMVEQAETMLAEANIGDAMGVAIFDPRWHSGIVGLVASKIKEALHRPVIALAPAGEGSDELRGSARSIPGFHLRDALALVDTRHPGLLLKFGGHAMAAGLSMRRENVQTFIEVWDSIVRETIDPTTLDAVIYSDGSLPPEWLTLDFAHRLRLSGPWGQSFPEPVFDDLFYCHSVRVLSGKHFRLDLVDPRTGDQFTGIQFNVADPSVDYTGQTLHVAYELNVNSYRGNESLQLMIRYLQPIQKDQSQ